MIHQTHPVDKKYVMGGGKSEGKGRGEGAKLSEESIKLMVIGTLIICLGFRGWGFEESIKLMVIGTLIIC